MRTYQISGFTHTGTCRSVNEDAILLNGIVSLEGFMEDISVENLYCFVADGVGGNPDGDFASSFVLQSIMDKELGVCDIKSTLHAVNSELLSYARNYPNQIGPATTLTGIISNEKDSLTMIHAGDSELWLYRNSYLLKQSTDQVLDDLAINSPIVSYFGGSGDYLDLEIKDLDALQEDELLILCSDGLFKSISNRELVGIFSLESTLSEKLKKILEHCLSNGAIDNVSVILISLKSQTL